MKINDIKGINETFEQVPSLEKVHILEDGRHFFNEEHAKSANGSETSKGKDGKLVSKLKAVKYKTLEKGAKELTETPAAA
jgi:hypothetical protein